MAAVDLAGLGLDEGGHLLLARALATLAPGERLTVTGRHPALRLHLAAWCRAHGHQLAADDARTVVKGDAGDRRWAGAARAGDAAPIAVAALDLRDDAGIEFCDRRRMVGRREKKRVLYGYLATVKDLDKVDMETKKKTTIESLRELAGSK